VSINTRVRSTVGFQIFRGRCGDPVPKTPDPTHSRGNQSTRSPHITDPGSQSPVVFSLCVLSAKEVSNLINHPVVSLFDTRVGGTSTEMDTKGVYLKLPATTSRERDLTKSGFCASTDAARDLEPYVVTYLVTYLHDYYVPILIAVS
jgi:hypothetical protein